MHPGRLVALLFSFGHFAEGICMLISINSIISHVTKCNSLLALTKLNYTETSYNFCLTSQKCSCSIPRVACLFHTVCSFLIISTLHCFCQCLCIRRKRFTLRLYPLPENTGGEGKVNFI